MERGSPPGEAAFLHDLWIAGKVGRCQQSAGRRDDDVPIGHELLELLDNQGARPLGADVFDGGNQARDAEGVRPIARGLALQGSDLAVASDVVEGGGAFGIEQEAGLQQVLRETPRASW